MKTNQPSIDLDTVVATAKTGDLMLFRGKKPSSHLMEAVEHSRWSHVAMLVRTHDDRLLFWESEQFPALEDEMLHIVKSGPQLVEVRARVKSVIDLDVTEAFAYRRLEKEISQEQWDKLCEFAAKVHKLPFPKTAKLIVQLFEGAFKHQIKPRDYFCSELVAESYMAMGLLPEGRPINNYWPKHFADGEVVSRSLIGNQLGEELLLEV